ncbi:MAG: hypothetical protein ABIM42_01890 [candidate division WOR-3 bacterium]
MKPLILAVFFLTTMGFAFGGEGDKPSPQDTVKPKSVKIEPKKFKDENKDGFNDLRDKGKYEKLLQDAIKEKKGKK